MANLQVQREISTQTLSTSYRVLIVDDDQDLGKMLSEYLRLVGTFQADAALNVQALWRCLAGGHYDALLLDYNLPDGDGLSVLSEMAKRGYQIPVVMVTGQGDERTAAQAIQRGAVEYIVKDGSYDFIKSLPGVVNKVIELHHLKQAVERAQEKTRYQAFLLNNVQDAVVVWDAQGKIIFWNQAAQSIFGWSETEQKGQQVESRYFITFTPPLSKGKIDILLEREIERLCINRKQESIWVSSRITPLRDKNDPSRITGYMDVSRDITERKNMEIQVQDAQAQLVQSQRLASIGELASGIAHQINNPLTTIIADAQILLNQLPSAHPARESARAIEQAGWRTQKVVQLLLEFSRPVGDMQETVSLYQTIEDALTLVGASLNSSGIKINTNLTLTSPKINGSARQLVDLWVHLLLLARDAIANKPANGTLRSATNKPTAIQIRTFRQSATPASENLTANPAMIVVEIHDDGKVIPAEQLGKVFEPNFTGPVAGRGTGIELSICREIVRQHQGQINAQSSPSEGTTFRVYLPLRG
jgi:PAS domain S-box-containing protein